VSTTPQTPPTELADKPGQGEMTPERAVAWLDDAIGEFEHALNACIETGVEEALVSAKINGFIMRFMARQPDVVQRAAEGMAAGEVVSVEDNAAAS
jgi:hypothetical protein